jgi:hypothetical protein
MSDRFYIKPGAWPYCKTLQSRATVYVENGKIEKKILNCFYTKNKEKNDGAYYQEKFIGFLWDNKILFNAMSSVSMQQRLGCFLKGNF